MPDPVDIRKTVNLPPEETVRAFDARADLQTTVRWSEMWEGEHAHKFTVAKIAKLDLLEDVRTSLAGFIHNGGTVEQWKDQIIPDLQRAGWWGKVENAELTGTNDPVFVGPRRLENIFRTNLRVSRAAGRWSRIQELKGVAPYLAYSAVDDGHARQLHALWGGLLDAPRIILPVDHPVWAWLYPPNDWGCRCDVLQLSDRDLERLGWKVTENPPDGSPAHFFTRAGAAEPVGVPAGIGPGWAYNAGVAGMRAISEKAAASIARSAAEDAVAARAVLDDLVGSRAFLKAMDEPGTSFPVMVVDKATAAELGALPRMALLAADTYAEQLERHPDVSIAHYRRLPAIGTDADIIARVGDEVMMIAKGDDGDWLVTVLEVSEGANVLLVRRVFRNKSRDLKRLLKDAQIVRDRRRQEEGQ